MNELAKELRDRSQSLTPRRDALGLRAADEIERLEARIAELEAKLKTQLPPFQQGGVSTEPPVPMLKRRGRPPKAR